MRQSKAAAVRTASAASSMLSRWLRPSLPVNPPAQNRWETFKPAAAEQIERLRLAAIGEFVPPDADGGDSRGHILRDVFFKGPTKGGRLTDRQFSHPCPLRRKSLQEVPVQE